MRIRTVGSGLVAALLGLALPLGTVEAGARYERLQIGTAHRALFAVDFDGREAYAVGNRGRILHSADGGASWAPEPVDSALAFLAVSARGGRSLAVGQMGQAARRGADGRWQAVDTGSGERLMGVALDRDGIAIAVGSFGELLRSDDAGEHWQDVALDWPSLMQAGIDPHLYAVQSTAAGRFVVAGEAGLLMLSEDGGRSWRKLHEGDASLFALHIRRDGVGFAVGQSGLVLRTADGGEHWERVEVDSEANLLGVHANRNGQVLAVGMREMLQSADHGRQFAAVRDGDVVRVWFSGVGAPEGAEDAFAVGQTERIVRVGL